MSRRAKQRNHPTKQKQSKALRAAIKRMKNAPDLLSNKALFELEASIDQQLVSGDPEGRIRKMFEA